MSTALASIETSGQTLITPEYWRSAIYNPQPIFQQDTIKICFLGDVMMHKGQIENAHRGGHRYDFSSFFSLIEDDIKDADLSVANMEFTLSGEPYSGYPFFSAPDGFEKYLAECGFDIFLAANNHIFDKRAKGAERTLEKYRELSKSHGIRFTGLAGNEEELEKTTPLSIRVKGILLSFINFTYGTNLGCEKHWPKTNYERGRQRLTNAFKTAEDKNSDFIIALPHWGIEYKLTHCEEQEKLAEWMIGSGADAIIGTHPHVVQDYQEINGVPVVYSLGNAVSNMKDTNTQLGMMATLRIVRHSNGDLEMLSPSLKYIWCSLPGGYNNSFTVIPVEDFLGKRDLWHGKWDYDKMVKTYNRIIENE